MTNDKCEWRFARRMTGLIHFFFGFGLEPNSPASPFFGGGGGGAAGLGGGALGGPFRMVESIPGFLGAGAGLGFAAGGGGGQVSYSRNPEAVKAATDRKAAVDKIVAELAATAKA